ncbi:hypothetical protein [Moritella sp. 28]|uniref:hypothetical protein n=1 Tax=Moritella sp. 28 TaxID=2746232 RepID=UPI001BA775C7|nr:hypothetical protein [Moritella sp. 28]QUM85731.1 hypothetical protein HWV02_15025 [Moritella sp. 28]
MSLFSQLLAFVFIFMFLACILYVIFGQVTVRKLRNNPKTKDQLGLEYASGWDIINVAQALAFPRSWSRKLEKSPLSSMYANSQILFENTNKFDRFLGIVFYWLFMTSGLTGALLVLLNFLGVFD